MLPPPSPRKYWTDLTAELREERGRSPASAAHYRREGWPAEQIGLNSETVGVADVSIGRIRRGWIKPRAVFADATPGTTILLVDQMAALALSVADRAYVLQTGTIRYSWTAQEVRRDPTLLRAYLGDHATVL